METEMMRQSLTAIGCSPNRLDQIVKMTETDQLPEVRQRLRSFRCDLIEELHCCQRRVDQLDWLIRETEKTLKEKK